MRIYKHERNTLKIGRPSTIGPETRKAILAMRLDGKSVRVIAGQFRLSKSAVGRVLSRNSPNAGTH